MAHRPDKAQKMKLYRQTVEGKASQMWSGIVGRCGNRFNNAKSYETVQIHFTRGEFIRWVVPELEKWIKHKPIASASVDRINSLRGYSLDNIRLLERVSNTLRQSRYKNVNAPNGLAWCGKCKDYLETSQFTKNKRTFNGFDAMCKTHKREKDRK